MRILLIANEHPGFFQIGFRRPLQDLERAGLISGHSVLSPQALLESGVSKHEVRQLLFSAFEDLLPDLVFVMHPHITAIRQQDIDRLRKIKPFKLIVWEGDAYSLTRKPPSISDMLFARNSDFVFTVGRGSLASNFKLLGARRIDWVPHCFEADRVPMLTDEQFKNLELKFDVSIIGNRSAHRIRSAPNWKQRARFIELAQEAFGNRLAVFGTGWSGESAKGPAPFDQQHLVISSSRITANWDHYAQVPFYFSNRLPISLASGSVHATTCHPGYREIFPSNVEKFLILASSPQELLNRIQDHLAKTKDEEYLQLKIKASRYAFKNFRQDDWFVRMLNFDGININPEGAKEAWTK